MKERMYSIDGYEEFIGEFLSENECYRSILDRDVYKQEDLFSLDREEMVKLIVDNGCKNASALSYLQTNRTAMKRFFDWSVEHGKISFNKFDTDAWSYSVFSEYMLGKVKQRILYPEDLDRIIASDDLNRDITRFILKGMYYGINTIENFAKMRDGDIDYDNNTITICGNKITVPIDVIDSIKKYNMVNEYIYIFRRYVRPTYKTLYKFGDRLIRTHKSVGDDITYTNVARNCLHRYFNNINDIAGYNINPRDVYISGFINYVRSQVENDNDLVLIFKPSRFPNYPKSGMEYAKEFGMECTDLGNIKQKVYPYLLNSRYCK